MINQHYLQDMATKGLHTGLLLTTNWQRQSGALHSVFSYLLLPTVGTDLEQKAGITIKDMHGDSQCKVKMHICKTLKIYSYEKMTDMSTGCQALGRGD